jgi:hypothetical protein
VDVVARSVGTPVILAALATTDADASDCVHVIALEMGADAPIWDRQFDEIRGDVDLCLCADSDLDGDGERDCALSTRMVGFFTGVVYAFDAAGRQIWVAHGEGEEADFGERLAGGCDLDRDGCEDLLVSAMSPYNRANPGHVFALSGKSGQVLYAVARQ